MEIESAHALAEALKVNTAVKTIRCSEYSHKPLVWLDRPHKLQFQVLLLLQCLHISVFRCVEGEQNADVHRVSNLVDLIAVTSFLNTGNSFVGDQIKADGVRALVEALKVNNTLTSVK